jgi:acyl-CoA thioester hydrolase
MDWPFHMPIRVPWSDTDPAGIVWFGNFFRYVEAAEEELFRALGHDRNAIIERFNIWMPRVDLACRFRAPARLGDGIDLVLHVEQPNDRRVVYPFEFRNGERLLAQGFVKVACVDRDTFTGRAFPDEVRAMLSRAHDPRSLA